MVVQAVFNQGGVLGHVTFSQESRGDPVNIDVDLEGLDQYSDNYRWSVHDFPIRSSLLRNFPNSNANVGGIYNPTGATVSGDGTPVNCRSTPATCAVGDLTSKHGPLRPEINDMDDMDAISRQISFTDPNLDLFDSPTIIGRSLIIDREDGPPGAFIGANIEPVALSPGKVETLRASFDNGVIQGDVIIRITRGRDVATVEADLYKVADGEPVNSQNHFWSLNFGPADSSCGGLKQEDSVSIVYVIAKSICIHLALFFW